jgi:hypothetical protein
MIRAGRIDAYGTRLDDATAPIVAITLDEKVAAVARFGLEADNALEDWTVAVDPDLDGWVIRWAYARITIGERSDLELARFAVRERTAARQFVDAAAMTARRALGWGRGEPYVRCVVCRTSDAASRQHRPGSSECRDTQAERRWDHAH